MRMVFVLSIHERQAHFILFLIKSKSNETAAVSGCGVATISWFNESIEFNQIIGVGYGVAILIQCFPSIK